MTAVAETVADQDAVPVAARYEPTRAGVIGVWDYKDEEFSFADGRLVLRGPNGSGKTKAMEVLYPFVIDGRIEPRRLNPFADEDRTMKSNLLYGGREIGYGYVWMEFARRDLAGDVLDAVTVGVGMHARKAVERVTRWHFVAAGRVGVDFPLLLDDDRPLTKKQLAERIGEDNVFDKAGDYRQRIDDVLFGLGSERYEQMLNLILTLRRPQLAKGLDPKALSKTLADDVTARTTESCRQWRDLARAYRERELAERAQQDAEREAAAAKVRLIEIGAELEALGAHEALKEHGRIAALDEEIAALAERRSERAETAHRFGTTETEQAGLVRAAEKEIVRQEREVSASAQEMLAHAATAGIGWSAADADDDQRFRERAFGAATARQEDVQEVREKLAVWSEAAGLVRTATEAKAKAEERRRAAEDDLGAAEAALAATRQRLAQAVADRSVAHAEVTALVDADVAEHGLPVDLPHLDADANTDDDDADDDDADDDSADGDADGEPVTTLTAALTRATRSVELPDQPTLREVYNAWTEPLTARTHQALSRLGAEIELREAAAGRLTQERRQIEGEHDDAPRAASGRPDHASRAGRRGAPLWRLVRFRDEYVRDTGLATAAAVEAALEATGLLDAWIHPSGDHAAEGGQPLRDGFLDPLPAGRRPVGDSLASYLEVEEQDLVPADRVSAVLASVAVAATGSRDCDVPAAATTVVTVDGRYRNGILVGAAAKPSPEYVGATFRARRRAARLAEIDVQLADLGEQVGRLTDRRAVHASTLDLIRAAARDLPPSRPVHDALAEVRKRAGALPELTDAVRRTADDLDRKIAAESTAERQLAQAARQRRLPIDPPRLASLDGAVLAFRAGAERVLGAREIIRREAAVKVGAVGRAEQARRYRQEAEDQVGDLDGEHRRATAMRDKLAQTVGAPVARILAEITSLEGEQKALTAEHGRLEKTERRMGETRAAAQQRIDLTYDSLKVAIREEQTAARRLAPFARREVIDVLGRTPAVPWPGQLADWRSEQAVIADGEADLVPGHDDPLTDALAEGVALPPAPPPALPPGALAMHAAVLAATEGLTPTAASVKAIRSRAVTGVETMTQQLAQARQNYRPHWDFDDDLLTVGVEDETGLTSVATFAARLSDQLAEQQDLMAEHERRLLEDELLEAIARQIHQRSIEARDLVRRMNADMRARRMSSGSTVGIAWEMADELDPGQRRVVKLLETDAAQLGPDGLATIRGHFTNQIKAARAREPQKSYADLLAHVLDYRRWRTFVLFLVDAADTETRMTKAVHSRLSGGEKSVSLHLPLFAAANAMFSSGRADSPRMIALDEAFAGVDDNGQSELMGLSVQFDLDLFMTGYDLWCTHATVPMAAHYDLAHSVAAHTVSALLIVWDGSATLQDSPGRHLAEELGSPRTRKLDAGQQTGLLAGTGTGDAADPDDADDDA